MSWGVGTWAAASDGEMKVFVTTGHQSWQMDVVWDRCLFEAQDTGENLLTSTLPNK